MTETAVRVVKEENSNDVTIYIDERHRKNGGCIKFTAKALRGIGLILGKQIKGYCESLSTSIFSKFEYLL